MHDPQAAQRFDEVQLPGIEVPEFLVAVEQGFELWRLFVTVAREEHPQVLHCRAVARIVEVDDMQSLAGNEHVTRMKVTVQPQPPDVSRPRLAGCDSVEHVLGNALVCGRKLRRNEVVFQQVLDGGNAITFDVDIGPVVEVMRLTDQVDTCGEPTKLLEEIEVIEVRGTPAVPRIYGKSKRAGLVQGLASDLDRRHHGQFRLGKVLRKPVLFDDRLIRPARRPVKFCNDWRGVFDANLVHAILITVECEKSTITAKRESLERLDDLLWLQFCVGESGVVRGIGHQANVLPCAAMKMPYLLLSVLALLAVSGCTARAEFDLTAYTEEVEQWRADRAEYLIGPDGFVNIVGLYWLEKDVYRIGSAPGNDIVFPESAAANIGELRVTPEGVLLVVEPGVEVLHDGWPVSEILMVDDTKDSPVTITHGSFAWLIISRDERYAMRLRDYEHPGIAGFGPMQWFEIDPAYRLTATLRPWDEPRVLNVGTTIEGLGFNPVSPGKLAFEVDGTEQELEAYWSGERLYIVFADRTTGRQTYPAGRYMYLAAPDEEGKTIIDFNKAFSPPCAYNDFATCPVASPRNRLSVSIEAGEKYDPKVHKTGALD